MNFAKQMYIRSTCSDIKMKEYMIWCPVWLTPSLWLPIPPPWQQRSVPPSSESFWRRTPSSWLRPEQAKQNYCKFDLNKAEDLRNKSKLPRLCLKWESVTHPPTLGNLLLQVCRCYDQQADGLQRIKQCLLQTGHMQGKTWQHVSGNTSNYSTFIRSVQLLRIL